MLTVFSSNGPRSISAERIVGVYRDSAAGRYVQATLVLDTGEEVTGLVLVAALDALKAKLDGDAPPPMAA